MKRKGMWLALAVVLAANGVVLAGVSYNRSGTPDARLVLTSRELPVSWGFNGPGSGSENSGLSLRIDWTSHLEGEKHILTREKMESLGFHFPPESQYVDWAHHKKPLDRMAYAVFEYMGAAWDQVLKAKQAELEKNLAKAVTDTMRKNLQQNYEQFEKASSRLVLVDIGADPAQLRSRYADRSKYLIAKVKVSVYYYNFGVGKEELQANITTLLPDEVYVPRQYHDLIRKPGQDRSWGWKYQPGLGEVPPYQVVLAYGRRLEPWVESVSAKPAP